ncbi:MAG: hypothetical protein DMG05_19990 [Acidobacteria bacterium]|nr:MAG: hypothetical protein DMG05_19990 [Acidobacteriota bacterium]
MLPSHGVQTGETANPATTTFLRSLHALSVVPPPSERISKPKLRLRVLDSVRENGAKLVELSPQEAMDLRAES